mmetsp:Transcript_30172/g.86416  ORF Transcript_30172/g.86416 Transcript_30172/m.86416 type:complete len:411 (-) Transcript_30172:77-1309(-)
MEPVGSEGDIAGHLGVEAATVEDLVPLNELSDALAQRRLRLIAQLLGCERDVGVGPQHVAGGGQGHVVADGFPAEELFQEVHKVAYCERRLVAEVVNLARRGLHAGAYVVQGGHGALDDVIDVREVALELRAVRAAEDPELLSSHDGVRKAEGCHVGPAKRAIDGEETESRQGDPVYVVVRVRQHLIGLLRGGIEAGRPVYSVLLREGHLGVEAVDRARGRVNHPRHGPPVLDDLQECREARNIGGNVRARVLRRVPHAGLRRKVQHVREVAQVHGRAQHACVIEVGIEGENARVLELAAPGALEAHRVVRIEVVIAKHAIPALLQQQSHMVAYEASSAGYKHYLAARRRRSAGIGSAKPLVQGLPAGGRLRAGGAAGLGAAFILCARRHGLGLGQQHQRQPQDRPGKQP